MADWNDVHSDARESDYCCTACVFERLRKLVMAYDLIGEEDTCEMDDAVAELEADVLELAHVLVARKGMTPDDVLEYWTARRIVQNFAAQAGVN